MADKVEKSKVKSEKADVKSSTMKGPTEKPKTAEKENRGPMKEKSERDRPSGSKDKDKAEKGGDKQEAKRPANSQASNSKEKNPTVTRALERLQTAYKEQGGKLPMPAGWRIELRTRASGTTKGEVDTIYVAPDGHKYRTQREAVTLMIQSSKGKQLTPVKPAANAAAGSKLLGGGVPNKNADTKPSSRPAPAIAAPGSKQGTPAPAPAPGSAVKTERAAGKAAGAAIKAQVQGKPKPFDAGGDKDKEKDKKGSGGGDKKGGDDKEEKKSGAAKRKPPSGREQGNVKKRKAGSKDVIGEWDWDDDLQSYSLGSGYSSLHQGLSEDSGDEVDSDMRVRLAYRVLGPLQWASGQGRHQGQQQEGAEVPPADPGALPGPSGAVSAPERQAHASGAQQPHPASVARAPSGAAVQPAPLELETGAPAGDVVGVSPEQELQLAMAAADAGAPGPQPCNSAAVANMQEATTWEQPMEARHSPRPGPAGETGQDATQSPPDIHMPTDVHIADLKQQGDRAPSCVAKDDAARADEATASHGEGVPAVDNWDATLPQDAPAGALTGSAGLAADAPSEAAAMPTGVVGPCGSQAAPAAGGAGAGSAAHTQDASERGDKPRGKGKARGAQAGPVRRGRSAGLMDEREEGKVEGSKASTPAAGQPLTSRQGPPLHAGGNRQPCTSACDTAEAGALALVTSGDAEAPGLEADAEEREALGAFMGAVNLAHKQQYATQVLAEGLALAVQRRRRRMRERLHRQATKLLRSSAGPLAKVLKVVKGMRALGLTGEAFDGFARAVRRVKGALRIMDAA